MQSVKPSLRCEQNGTHLVGGIGVQGHELLAGGSGTLLDRNRVAALGKTESIDARDVAILDSCTVIGIPNTKKYISTYYVIDPADNKRSSKSRGEEQQRR